MSEDKNILELELDTTDSLPSINESNRFIGRKGNSSLMATKIMLYSLLKIEDRTDAIVPVEELEYYSNLKSETKVDYTKGLVAEFNSVELRKVLNRKACGTFYNELRALFGDIKSNPKSLRNQFSVLVPSKSSNISGYTEIITACHYDSSNGRMFIKFNNEVEIREMLLNLREEYTEIPLSVLNANNVYELRLTEMIYKHVSEVDKANLAAGKPLSGEYIFSYTVGELQMMFGVLDVTTDEISRKQLQVNNPDFNQIAMDFQSRNPVNLGEYRRFRMSVIEVAVKAINDKTKFHITYEAVRSGSRGKITSIIFNVKDKTRIAENNIIDMEVKNENKELDANTIMEISTMLDDLFSISDIKNLWLYSEKSVDKIQKGYELFKATQKPTDKFVSWFKNTMGT